jgi:hypothetical protein
MRKTRNRMGQEGTFVRNISELDHVALNIGLQVIASKKIVFIITAVRILSPAS